MQASEREMLGVGFACSIDLMSNFIVINYRVGDCPLTANVYTRCAVIIHYIDRYVMPTIWRKLKAVRITYTDLHGYSARYEMQKTDREKTSFKS